MCYIGNNTMIQDGFYEYITFNDILFKNCYLDSCMHVKIYMNIIMTLSMFWQYYKLTMHIK